MELKFDSSLSNFRKHSSFPWYSAGESRRSWAWRLENQYGGRSKEHRSLRANSLLDPVSVEVKMSSGNKLENKGPKTILIVKTRYSMKGKKLG